MYSQNISHLIYIDNMGRKTGSNNPSQSGAKAQQQINHLEKKTKVLLQRGYQHTIPQV